MKLSTAFALMAGLLGAAAIVLPGSGADAQRGLRAQIYLTQARIPGNVSEQGLLSFARRTRQPRLQESDDSSIRDRKWLANMVVAFNRPVGDLEFHVLFYDVHDGPRRFVEDMSTFVSDRDQKTFVQRVRLERPRFRPNRNMELVVTVRRQEVGRLSFGLVGEEIRRTGEVDFSEDEVN